jgi:hypothetical protein
MTKDSFGFTVDISGDGGDTCRAEGILAVFGRQNKLIFCQKDGYGVRHPYQEPWDNPKNFTRDQEICRMAGLYKINTPESRRQARITLWKYAKRLFFANNFERDKVGSKKYPYRHTFINDKGISETRNFDFADLLMPHHIFFIILCSRVYCLYPFAIIGWPFFLVDCLFNGKDLDSEQNQKICMLSVYGKFFKWVYFKRNKLWVKQIEYYWETRRKDFVMAEIIISGVNEWQT